ncbi:MAG: SulP family inorganic anion transporter [Phycisphaeraceae bacterium]
MRDLISPLAEPIVEPMHRLGRTLRGYNWRTARADGLAGLSVAVIAVPQAVAFAIIADVPPEYGLYTLIIQCFIASLFNSQPLLSVGPTNTHSLLIASLVTRLAGGQPELYLTLAIALTLVKGLMQMAMAWARLGRLVQYVSQSVIVGFTAGAGVLIAAGQIKNFLGVQTQRGADDWPGLIGTVQRLWPHVTETSPWAVALGVLALVLLVGSRKVSKLAPGPLVAVAACAVVVYVAGLGPERLTLVPALPSGMPAPRMPTFELEFIEPLLTGALALSLLGLMEAYSIGKSLATKTGTRISANQELFSQGITNFLSSFFACIPGSGSFSRSALNHYAGAKTQISGVFNSLFVLAIFLLAAPAARYIPMSAIAAILFIVAYGLIDFHYFRRVLRSERADAVVCFGTFFATLLVPLSYAVFVGIFLNIALYLRRASQLHLQEMVRSPGGPFVERPLRARTGDKNVIFLQAEGDLFFGVADELQDRLSQIAYSGVHVVILRLKRTHSIDATVFSVLEQFAGEMQARDGHVVLCGIREELYQRMESFGLVDKIGRENVFQTRYGVFASAKAALQRARQLVGSSIDLDQDLVDENDTEGWAYEI